MKLLEDRILKDGVVKKGNVLKVDNFLNHQMDVKLFRQMAEEWKRLFADKKINKILEICIESKSIKEIMKQSVGLKEKQKKEIESYL